MKDLTENLLNSRKSHRASYALFNSLTEYLPMCLGRWLFLFLIWVAIKSRCGFIGLPAIQACNALLNRLVMEGTFDSLWEFYEDML